MAFIQMMTTTETKEQAQTIARHLVDKKLAACVQITGPVESLYSWKGKIEKAREWLCLIKTREDLFPKIESAIKELHTYETPEIIAVPMIKVGKDYRKWMQKSLTEKP